MRPGNCVTRYSLEVWLLFGILFSFCSPWIVWANSLSAILQYTITLCLFVIFLKQRRFKSARELFVFGLLFLYFVLFQFWNQLHISYIAIAIAYLVSSKMTREEGREVIRLTTNYIFISIIVPLPLWLFHQFVHPLPIYDILDVTSWKHGNEEMLYENHFFFISVDGFEAMRFYSWYDEPGVLGTFSAFVLWANKYNIKKFNVLTIFIGSLFTFSMAYYILTLIGWIFVSKSSINKMLTTFVFLGIVGLGLFYLMEENIAFQQSVISRVSNPEESGVDSRIGVEIDQLWNKYKDSEKIIMGLGSGALEKWGGVSKSYKCFLLELGYIGLFLVLLAYLTLMRRKDKYAFFTLFIFLLSFLQRPQLYTAFDFVLYSSIILNFENNKKKYRYCPELVNKQM